MVYLKSVENVITLGKLIGLLFLFCLPLLSILFLKTKRNDLARPVMGTIFLVYSLTCYREAVESYLLPARASEQGNVIGSVRIYIYIYIVIDRTRDLNYLKFVATDFSP